MYAKIAMYAITLAFIALPAVILAHALRPNKPPTKAFQIEGSPDDDLGP